MGGPSRGDRWMACHQVRGTARACELDLRSVQRLVQNTGTFTETGNRSVVSRGWEQRGVDARFLFRVMDVFWN